MKDQDNKGLNDKEIRDLLKLRLLEQSEDNDLVTQKLIDMEAKLVFSGEALYVPSLQKEKELLKKLQHGRAGLLKWLLSGFGLLAIAFIFYYFSEKATVTPPTSNKKEILIPSENNIPQQKNDAIVLEDSAFAESRSVNIKMLKNDTIRKDTLRNEKSGKWTVGDPAIKAEYKPRKHDPKFIDLYDNIPVLSKAEIENTKKFKDRMVKQLLKKDKRSWVYVPMSTDSINGEVVSLNAFYIAASEVTNNQYRTFLNDLLIQGKIDNFFKAVPDSSKWISDGRALFLRLQPDSTKWPHDVNIYFEPMRKNYYWHLAYDSYPVLNVSREGAKLYCDWLTDAVNSKIKESNSELKWNALFINDVRIPQDVEWITAARSGHGNVDYPWSNKFGKTESAQNLNGCYLANFCRRNYNEAVTCPNIKFTDSYTTAGTVSREYTFVAPVMSYNPNDYGLYCVSGNAAEMVWVNKTGKPGTKGGSWGSDAQHIKINGEDEYSGITNGSIYIGFRPVFTAAKK